MYFVDSGKSVKLNLYDNFVSGEKINQTSELKPPAPHHDIAYESRRDSFDRRSHSQHFGPSDYEEDRRRNGTTIYVSFNDISDAVVREIFEPYGPILNIRIDERKW